jgi:hypothetical protein
MRVEPPAAVCGATVLCRAFLSSTWLDQGSPLRCERVD